MNNVSFSHYQFNCLMASDFTRKYNVTVEIWNWKSKCIVNSILANNKIIISIIIIIMMNSFDPFRCYRESAIKEYRHHHIIEKKTRALIPDSKFKHHRLTVSECQLLLLWMGYCKGVVIRTWITFGMRCGTPMTNVRTTIKSNEWTLKKSPLKLFKIMQFFFFLVQN